MTTLAKQTYAMQNMGLIDRMVRIILGASLLGVAYYYYVPTVDLNTHVWDYWASYAMVISVYPIFTAILGWEPVYAFFHVRTCGDTGRNQCGSFPYQVKAMSGKAPQYCDTDSERSLEACHDEKKAHPRHKLWRIDRDPIFYPDERAWHGFFKAHKKIKVK